MEKENEPSGTYVIDEDYNIVTFNETASHTYPQLEIGKKCVFGSNWDCICELLFCKDHCCVAK